MFRKSLGLAVVLSLLMALFTAAPATAWTIPSDPVPVYDASSTTLQGDILAGAVPANWTAKPVLVFVQGLHGSAGNWWGPTSYYGDNDMYDYAYNNGYRTFFIQFRDADGNAGSMWLNGSVLRQQLEWITKYSGVSKVNIVAHSKGGIDSQSAIVHYGAAPYVGKVLTLSSPHRGSELADLSYSWWAWWLGALLGQHDDGTYVMQTGYMDYFRSVTDGRPEDLPMSNYYTLGGTHHGPWFSALWYGGSYLNAYGPNDGVVRTYSAHALPGHSGDYTDGSWNHDNIRMGSKVFSWVNSKTGSLAWQPSELFAIASPRSAATQAANAATTIASGQLYRGGQLAAGRAQESIPVESGAVKVSFDVLSSAPGLRVALVSPSGQRFEANQRSAADEYFRGAERAAVTIDKPEAGYWTLEMSSPDGAEGAYLATAFIDGGLTAALSKGPGLVSPAEKLDLQVNLMGAEVASASAGGVLLRTTMGNAQPTQTLEIPFASWLKGKGLLGTLPLPQQEGVYNLSLTITGTLADGSPFERSLVTSYAVAAPGDRGIDHLKGLGK